MILLDTHVVVWLAFGPNRVSRRAKAATDKARIHLDISLETFLPKVEARFTVLPTTGHACVLALELPAAYPEDPADRIIAATDLAEGLPLLTADRAIHRSKALATIWRAGQALAASPHLRNIFSTLKLT